MNVNIFYAVSTPKEPFFLLYEVNDNHNLQFFFCPFFTELTSIKNRNMDKIKCTNHTPEPKTNFGRNIVIFVGSTFSFLLILAILREICLWFRFSRPTGQRTTFDDVYTDIAEMEIRGTD